MDFAVKLTKRSLLKVYFQSEYSLLSLAKLPKKNDKVNTMDFSSVA